MRPAAKGLGGPEGLMGISLHVQPMGAVEQGNGIASIETEAILEGFRLAFPSLIVPRRLIESTRYVFDVLRLIQIVLPQSLQKDIKP